MKSVKKIILEHKKPAMNFENWNKSQKKIKRKGDYYSRVSNTNLLDTNEIEKLKI
jgi:hypothetical protein